MTYVDQGPACPKTCKYPDGDTECPTKEVEGCQCPKGLVQEVDINGDVKCVKASECKVCRVDGKIYTEGERFVRDCKKW